MELNASVDSPMKIINKELLSRWMYCLNALDIALNSKYACAVPEPIYIILDDARVELERLMAHYEGTYYTSVKGRT